MARSASRREVMLIGGMGLLVAAWLLLPGGDEQPKETAAAKTKAEKGIVLGDVPVVHMEQLDKTVVKYDSNGRDIFKYAPRPPSWATVREMRRQAELARKAQQEAEERARLEAERRAKEEADRAAYLALHPPPPPDPVPPPITFQFLGYVGPASDRIAAFEENNQTFVAKTGEIVKKNFKIQEIRYESVVIAYVDPKFKGKSRELPLTRGR